MENEKKEEETEQNKVVDLSKFESFKESSGDQNGRPKTVGYFLSAIGERLFEYDSPKDKKKKIRNLIIITVNFALMFIILSFYFSGKNNEENYEDSLPAEMMMEEEMMMNEEI